MHSLCLKTQTASLVEIRLYGHLRKRFGRSFNLCVSTAAEAVKAMCFVVPGFKKYITDHSQPGYRVWLDKSPIDDIDELRFPNQKLIRIVPVIAGSGKGIGQILFGVALIALSFYLPVGPLFTMGSFAPSLATIAMSMGVSMVLGGFAQMLAPSPKPIGSSVSERPNNQPSYAFNGAINTTQQGNAVPVLIGRLRVGSQVISVGLSATQMSIGDPAVSESPSIYYVVGSILRGTLK